MLKIKLVRIGKKNQPQYRIVVAEGRSKNGGNIAEQLGYYNPLAKPASLLIDHAKYMSWLKKGAIPTDTIRNLVKSSQPSTK